MLPLRILDKLGKSKEELKDTNMVMIDYRGKAIPIERVILFNEKVGIVKTSTLFVVILSKSSYNLLLSKD